MNQYTLVGEKESDTITIEAPNVGEARAAAESILESEIIMDPGSGFRWIRVRPDAWRYQIVDEEGTALLSVDLVGKA